MNLIRRSTSDLGLSSFEELDKLFDNLWGLNRPSVSLPSLDIYSEDDKNMVVEMPAPGFDHDDIEINARNGVLEIRGESRQKEEQGDKKRSYLVRERSASFARRIALPEGADASKISAELDKGLLRVTVPVARPKATTIKVKAKSSKAKNITASSK